MNHCFEIFEVFSFNRTDKAFEIFGPNGDSGYYNTVRRVPKRVATCEYSGLLWTLGAR